MVILFRRLKGFRCLKPAFDSDSVGPVSSIKPESGRMAGRNHLTPSFFVSVGADRHFYFVNHQYCQDEYVFCCSYVSRSQSSTQSFITNQIAQLLDVYSERVLICICIFRYYKIFFQHLIKLFSNHSAKIVKNDFAVYGAYLGITVTAEKTFPFIICLQGFIADFDLPSFSI